MPRPDKATFIQEMLSELSLQSKPIPDSTEWWKDVAQGLGVKLFDAESARDAFHADIASLRIAYDALQQEKAALEKERDEALIFMRAMKGVAEHSQERAEQAERERAEWKARATAYYVQRNEAEATTRRLADELAAGWDAETVKRQVADFNALCDAVRHHKEEARRLREALEATKEELELWRDSNWQALEAKGVRRG